MKKIFCPLLMIALFISCGSSKSITEGKDNHSSKAVSQLVKQFTDEGYKSSSMAFTMEEEITAFRKKLLSNSNLVEIFSEGKGPSSFAAEMAAQNAASIQYATAAKSVIEGGMEREFASTAENGGPNYEVFHGAYTQNVASFITPLLKKEMKFSKLENGNYYVKIGYLIDENKASIAREKAFDKSLEKLANGQMIGEAIRKYVKEIVKPNGNE